MKKRISYTQIALIAFGMIAGITASVNGAPKSPEQIMEKVDEQRSPSTARSRMSMRIFRSMDATEADREIRMLSYARGVEDSHLEFASPRNIRGLRVLDLDGAIRVFFPSTGRVRNIGSSDRGGSVGGVGGDFSYEDMGGSGFMADYKDFEIEEETSEVWKIAAVPVDENSRYSRLVFHIEKDRHIPVQIDYYENGEKAKELQASRIREISGRNVATHLIMRNIKNDSRTEILMDEVEWDVPLDDDLFHPNRFFR